MIRISTESKRGKNPHWVIAAVLVTACIGIGGRAQGQTDKIVAQIGVPVPNIGALQIYVAQEVGFFGEEGLSVELRYSSGAPQALQLVAAGQADVALGTLEPLINGHEAGLPLKAFASTNREMIYYVAVPEASPIKAVADLKNAKIGVANLGGAAPGVVRSIHRSGGVEPTSDSLLPVGFGDQALAALSSGRVQALGLWSNAYFAMERSGHRFRYFHHPTLGRFGNLALIASDRVLGVRKKEICGFARAVAKASAFAIENPEMALRIYWKTVPGARKGTVDAEDVKNGMIELMPQIRDLDIGFPPAAQYGTIDESALEQFESMLQEQGGTKTKPPAAAIVTRSILQCMNSFDLANVRERARGWK